MSEYLPTPTVGEVLVEEFMKPLNMSTATLADNLGLSVKYIRALLDGQVKVTPELSKKLADCFGMSELFFFFRLQNDIDSRNARLELVYDTASLMHSFGQNFPNGVFILRKSP